MISQLRGKIIHKQAPSVILDVAGVGYEVLVPMTTLYQLPDETIEVTLHTHLVVREDAHQLFGFINKRDKKLFQLLIRTNGIGPKSGLAFLSGMQTDELILALRDHDIKKITRIPGVGKKTAERLTLEIQDKLDGFGDATTAMSASSHSISSKQNIQDAISALTSLGYRPVDAEKIIKNIDEGASLASEQLIKIALKSLAA